MKFLRRVLGWIGALGKKAGWIGEAQVILGNDVSLHTEPIQVESPELCLNPTLIDKALTVPDLFAYPEIAVEAAIGKAVRLGMDDPLDLLKRMLEVSGGEFNSRWELVARAGMFQYRMGEFTKRIYHMGTEALDQNIPVNTISYRVCIERSLEELADELQQINGLLDGMGEVAEPGDTGYRGSRLRPIFMDEHMSPELLEAMRLAELKAQAMRLAELRAQVGPRNLRLIEEHFGSANSLKRVIRIEEPLNFGRPVGSDADLTEDERKKLKEHNKPTEDDDDGSA